MAVAARLIRGRIKSIASTKKLTKAMELVSGAKMRKAVSSVLGTRPYAELAWETIVELARRTSSEKHPLLRVSGKTGKILLIAIFSDRGLCGGFNSQLLKKLRTFVNLHRSGAVKVEVVAIGKRGSKLMRRAGLPIKAEFTGISNNPAWREIRPVAKMAIDEFKAGIYDKVILGYTDFVNAAVQHPRTRVLLPVDPSAVADELGAVGVLEPKKGSPSERAHYEYKFEPSADKVLAEILPRLVETQVFQAVLESAASEHSARMFAMKNASDAAEDMLGDLQFTFNQARQSAITREVAEISSGKAALE